MENGNGIRLRDVSDTKEMAQLDPNCAVVVKMSMLILGLMLRNVPGIKYIGEHIDAKWSGTLRKVALTVILTRAGLGLDLVKLRKMWLAVVRLAFLPCTAEIITVGVVSHFLLGFPWVWSMMLGCVLGALSPAVTVPSLVNLQDRKYGVTKGIPTMLLSAGGLDNVMCVTAFSVLLGIIFSSGDNLALTIAKGPLGIVAGIAYGFAAGIFLWYIPSGDGPNRVFYRYVMLLSAGLIALFGSSEVGLSGAGPIGCLTTATVAAYKWRQGRQPGEKDAVAGVMALTWMIVQHFLFGLIGAAVNIANIKSETAGLGIATLAIGLVARSLVSITVTTGNGFNWKERVFVTLTWLAKATVQAAFGGLALDNVRQSHDPDGSHLKYATDILTISVLAIIICAPVGATCIAVFGPKFLVQGDQEEVEEEVSKKETKVEKVAPPEVEVVVDLVLEKKSVRSSSQASLASTSFQSELSSVLRRRSKADILGFDNPAFDSNVKVRQHDNMEKSIDDVVDTKVELQDDVFEDSRKESNIDRKQRHVVIEDVTSASTESGIDLKEDLHDNSTESVDDNIENRTNDAVDVISIASSRSSSSGTDLDKVYQNANEAEMIAVATLN
ncbi:sodium/hydrogen exchanger 9B2-like [Dreissena polymorpha]|uniref:sodium/hydrogen exchanger 9B2-like n=1 Tax=Dreissena polymorpha TaxID=45954 RepID=UPI002264C0D1|nr:sodium/hydrogen exchanger 9B2-like [Dreissena polymorpha]